MSRHERGKRQHHKEIGSQESTSSIDFALWRGSRRYIEAVRLLVIISLVITLLEVITHKHMTFLYYTLDIDVQSYFSKATKPSDNERHP